MSKLPVPREIAPFDYALAAAPSGYHCGQCGAQGVKLWRDYNTFLCFQSLLCGACACAEQSNLERAFTVTEVDGGKVRVTEHPDRHGMNVFGGDQIGCRVPAVPTSDGSTFWGYTSVPADGVSWWFSLPLTVEANQ